MGVTKSKKAEVKALSYFMEEETEAQRQGVEREAEVQGFSTCPLRVGGGVSCF